MLSKSISKNYVIGKAFYKSTNIITEVNSIVTVTEISFKYQLNSLFLNIVNTILQTSHNWNIAF